MNQLTHLSLFSGIGGLDLAAEWAGFRTVGQCEYADYPTRILEKHWPDVPRWRDIRTLTKESFHERTGMHTVDVVSGGFPCQPFSVAGKRRGKEDDRYLWPEMLRVIKELRPGWVVGENVAGIVNMELDQVLADLEGEGYAARTFILPACGVDAPHRRYRVAIVGNAQHDGLSAAKEPRSIIETCQHSKEGKETPIEPAGTGMPGNIEALDYPNSSGCNRDNRWRKSQQPENGCRWAAEPGVGRVADGVPDRVDRIRCLGNAVVPQQFYPIFQAIAEVERLK